MALMDVDVLQVDDSKREGVLKSVIDGQGPPDGTVVVSLLDMGEIAGNDSLINAILDKLVEAGSILLVR